MIARPIRLRLSRRKGFDLQALSRATNGMEAVKVARPTKWGNRNRVGVHGNAEECVREFRLDALVAWGRADLEPLRGKNLACFCALDAPCHADVLLELANSPICEEVA